MVEGATIAPVILASDETQLSTFSGDKAAYPVYLTIGNIAKHVRRQPSRRATVLVAYIPLPDLACCSKATRSDQYAQVYHTALTYLLEPMVSAGKTGTKMVCPDGHQRYVFPILSALVCDHPERCKAACCPQNTCPQGDVNPKQRGQPTSCPRRDAIVAATLLRAAAEGRPHATKDKLKAKHLRPTYPPFWLDLPHFDIFSAFMPDLLHQLHKGVFHTHLLSWCNKLMSKGELDRRYMSMNSHPSLRQFKNGITNVKQWTGNEHKMMERVFIAAVGGGVNNEDAVKAARAVLDFIYLSELRTHTTSTLQELSEALATFHRFKYAFLPVRASPHFNIPKIHAMLHYIDSITSHGTTDGYNTESPERLHIEYAKKAYRATNKREYERQMVTWLRRQDAVHHLDEFIGWLTRGPSSSPTHRSPVSTLAQADTDDHGDGIEEAEAMNRVHDPKAFTRRTYYHLAQVAPLRLSIPVLQQHFGAADLHFHLNNFLNLSRGCRQLPYLGQNAMMEVYKQVVLHINPSDGIVEPFTDRIRATPAAIPLGELQKLGLHPAFDTVLVKRKPTPFPYRAARVRAIFNLPDDVATALGPLIPTSTMVYIEWFTEFQRRITNPMRMYELQWAVDRYGRRECEVVPLTSIIRSVHLAAKLENDLEHSLLPHSILDVHPGPFLVNDYLDLHTFFYL